MKEMADFRLLTNHGNALLLIAHEPRIRLRDVAVLLDITERAAQRIVADLVTAGYLNREREGRRNVYQVREHLTLMLPFKNDVDVGSLLSLFRDTTQRPEGAGPH